MIIDSRWARNRRGRGDMPPLVGGLEFFGDLSCSRTSIVSGAVATLGDASGNWRDFTQATSTKRPAYTASDSNFNGRPSMSFDGVDDVLVRAAGLPSLTTGTFYFVYRSIAAPFTGAIFAISTYSVAGFVTIGATSTTNLKAFYCRPGSSESSRSATIASTVAGRYAASASFTSGGSSVWTTYANGSAVGTNNATASSSGGGTATTQASIGADSGAASGFLNATISDILIYSKAHSADEVAAIDGWLKWRNGL